MAVAPQDSLNANTASGLPNRPIRSRMAAGRGLHERSALFAYGGDGGRL